MMTATVVTRRVRLRGVGAVDVPVQLPEEEVDVAAQTLLLGSADGGYPLVYVTRAGHELCHVCAAKSLILGDDQDFGDGPVEGYPHHEGEPVTCEDCGTQIVAAYGDPWGCETCQEEIEADPTRDKLSYNRDGDGEILMVKDTRGGSPLCLEHQRWCWRCRRCYSATQIAHHLTMGECYHEGRAISAEEGVLIVFPCGMAVEGLVRRDGVGVWLPGVSAGYLCYGYLAVFGEGEVGEKQVFAPWEVRRVDR